MLSGKIVILDFVFQTTALAIGLISWLNGLNYWLLAFVFLLCWQAGYTFWWWKRFRAKWQLALIPSSCLMLVALPITGQSGAILIGLLAGFYLHSIIRFKQWMQRPISFWDLKF